MVIPKLFLARICMMNNMHLAPRILHLPQSLPMQGSLLVFMLSQGLTHFNAISSATSTFPNDVMISSDLTDLESIF